MEFITYIAKSAGILTLFYLVYVFVLRKDTFFTANRTFLLIGIASAIFLPFVTFTTITFVAAPVYEVTENFSEIVPIQTTQATTIKETINFWQVFTVIYFVGLGIMTLRFGIQLMSLFSLLRKHPSKTINGFRFIEINDEIAPFSFFNYIVFNPETHEQHELEMILQHEKVHASQWHSIDLLLSNFVRVLQWINPISWLYKKSIEANLEFLADNQTVSSVPSKTEYQLALLKASSPLPVPALTNNFYHSFIKKRIIMLNKSNSNKYNQLKLMLVLPALALFLWSFNTEEVIEYTTPPAEISSAENNTLPIKKNALRFSAQTTDAELNALEDYFETNHPESMVKIAARKRDASGNLINFSFQTKFTGNDRFYTRFDRTAETVFQAVYIIEPQKTGALLISEIGKYGMQFKITENHLQILSIENNNGTLVSKNGKEKEAKSKEPILGKNPLYIINGKEYRKKELPVDKTIELDGKIEAYSQKEGEEKYGAKGEDGVLFFNGIATFKKVEATVSEKKTLAQPKNNAKPSVKEIRVKITKNTTTEELKAYKKELKQHDVDFNFSNIHFNSKGEITSISIKYSGHGNNGTYAVNSDDEEAIEDFYFYMDTKEGMSGFGSMSREIRTDQRMAMMESRKAMMESRKEALKNASEIRKEALKNTAEIRREMLNNRREEMSEVRSELAETRNRLRKENTELRKASSKLAKTSYTVNTNVNGNISDKIVITKNTSNAELKKMKAELSERGIDFNYKRVKRNSNGEITGIKATFNNRRGSKISKTIQTDDDEAIEMIVVEM